MASSFPQPLTEQEEQIYVEKSQQGDAEARGKLIEHNLRLVAHIAKIYESRRFTGRSDLHRHHRPDQGCQYLHSQPRDAAGDLCRQVY